MISAGAVPLAMNGTQNNNNKNSTPMEDRYAALKDLDEQLRESKAMAEAAASVVSSAVVDSFGNRNYSKTFSLIIKIIIKNNIPLGTRLDDKHNMNNGINPFKAQEQQQHQVNPFQAANVAQPPTTNLFGQMTVIPNGFGLVNGYTPNGQPVSAHPPFNQQVVGAPPQTFFNYSNGFAGTNGSTGPGSVFAPLSEVAPAMAANRMGVPNGCGFGFGNILQQQQQLTTAGSVNAGGAFNNPFGVS